MSFHCILIKYFATFLEHKVFLQHESFQVPQIFITSKILFSSDLLNLSLKFLLQKQQAYEFLLVNHFKFHEHFIKKLIDFFFWHLFSRADQFGFEQWTVKFEISTLFKSLPWVSLTFFFKDFLVDFLEMNLNHDNFFAPSDRNQTSFMTLLRWSLRYPENKIRKVNY